MNVGLSRLHARKARPEIVEHDGKGHGAASDGIRFASLQGL